MNCFISIQHNKERSLFDSPAFLFRKVFSLNKGNSKLTLKVCGLGYGVYYINGKEITSDKFITPVSDYRKTLWFSEYDVTDYCVEGGNVFYAKLGNGFFNENFESGWSHNKAEWRNDPCLWMELYQDDLCILKADNTFKACVDKATYYNQLRSGEYYDSQRELHAELVEFDDSQWQNAVILGNSPQGTLRRCFGPTIKECAKFDPVAVLKNNDGYVFDFGYNISGYAEIVVCDDAGKAITLSYAEEINDDNSLKLNGLGIYYSSVPCQVDKLICNGQLVAWKPQFTYHGFRYVQVSGLSNIDVVKSITAYFVHQDVPQVSRFCCSDETINKIYEAGIRSTQSNMFYSLTDCPTREKLGWLNDTQASLGQIMYNFDCTEFFEKWYQDICDSMRINGNVAGIAPTPDWGYEYGVVTSGAVITLPYMLYKLKGDKKLLETALPYMEKHYGYHCNNIGKSMLGDWTGADNLSTPIEFIDLICAYMFSSIISNSKTALNLPCQNYVADIQKYKSLLLDKYFINGKCKLNEQTALSASIVLNLGNKDIVSQQLVQAIGEKGNHIACGMFGIQFLYKALFQIGRADLWLKVIENDTSPSFKIWMDNGATTLYETFDETARTISRNHHMFSNVIEEFITEILGIKVLNVEKMQYTVSPAKIKAIEFAKGGIKLPQHNAEINVAWKNNERGREITVQVDGNVEVFYNGTLINGFAKINE